MGVWPTNCPELVADLLTALNLSASTIVSVKELHDMPIEEALLNHYEIARITPDILDFINERSGDAVLADLLKPERAPDLKHWLWGRQLIDLLETFPVKVTAQEWINALRKIQPRLYSISSSPKVHINEVHLTFSNLRYSTNGKHRGGVCSTFLADRAEKGSVDFCPEIGALPPACWQGYAHDYGRTRHGGGPLPRFPARASCTG
ncbi:hypothetical protein ACCY16_17675 [Candidatus Pantoea formicae]|uniref:hypothetical protein n=1 Tax=Candidatus Pantoea formicae TaxID=2608355 RepID=UPI003EDA8588